MAKRVLPGIWYECNPIILHACRFYLVVIQYAAKLNADKLRRAIQRLQGGSNSSSLSSIRYNFSLASAEVSQSSADCSYRSRKMYQSWDAPRHTCAHILPLKRYLYMSTAVCTGQRPAHWVYSQRCDAIRSCHISSRKSTLSPHGASLIMFNCCSLLLTQEMYVLLEMPTLMCVCLP